MTIQGSRDTDTTGRGLRQYEVSSPETSQTQQMTKASKWVFNIPHLAWGGSAVDYPNHEYAQALARAYVGGFLRWRLFSEAGLKVYFSTMTEPPCIADPALCGYGFEEFKMGIFGQFREPLSSRIHVHNFEIPPQNEPDPNFEFTVVPPDASAVVGVEGSNLDYSENLPTRALQLDGMASPAVMFNFGDDGLALSQDGLLSLRLAKRAEPLGTASEAECMATNMADLVVSLTLSDGLTQSTVQSSTYARITPPDHWFGFKFGTTGSDEETCVANEFFVTVRVPLADFTDGLDLENNVKQLTVGIDFQKNDDGEMKPLTILIDSVEFIKAAEQLCGDGILDPGEECDDGNLVDGDGCESDCTICTPGDSGCRCLDTDNTGEENADLPFGGILGDGRYCTDDVALSGEVRCVATPGDEQPGVCEPCFPFGEEPWCPCNPGDGCLGGLVCEFVCNNDVGDCEPAVFSHGNCFVDGEPDPFNGGRPEWYYDWYCGLKDTQLQCVHEEGENRVCQVEDGPPC